MNNFKISIIKFPIRIVAIFGLMFFLVVVGSAQSKKLEAATIKYAKSYLVSRIEKGLPSKPIGIWFQELVGKKLAISWEINDCGEQTGTSADRGRDFPMCIDAIAKQSANLFISVNIQYGTFKHGITRMKPVVRYISIGEEIGGEYIESLVDLQKRLIEMPKDVDFFDPNGGEFVMSDNKNPKGFEEFREMYLQTKDFDRRNKLVVVKPNGSVESWQQQIFAMQKIFFNGKRWTFETASIGGVSYKFSGKFIKIKRYPDGTIDGENVLKGRLIRFLNGKQTAAADLIFSFQVGDDS